MRDIEFFCDTPFLDLQVMESKNFLDWLCAHFSFAGPLRQEQPEAEMQWNKAKGCEDENLVRRSPAVKEIDESGASIEELIKQLQTGIVEQKCKAADELGWRGVEAIQATEALVAALSDLGEAQETACGLVGGGGIFYYVRESAVNALAKINPAAAAPLAIRVIAELSGKPKGYFVCSDSEDIHRVSFSDKTIAAFSPPSINADAEVRKIFEQKRKRGESMLGQSYFGGDKGSDILEATTFSYRVLYELCEREMCVPLSKAVEALNAAKKEHIENSDDEYGFKAGTVVGIVNDLSELVTKYNMPEITVNAFR